MRAPCKKVRYQDNVEALMALTRVERPADARHEVRAYRCRKCRGWHLTSMPLNGGLDD